MKFKRLIAVVMMAATIFCTSGCEKSENIQVFDADGEEITENAVSFGRKADAEDAASEMEDEQISSEAEGSIYVYVCGAVENPGVVEVPAGSRVFEAIRETGGMTEEAADFAVNQAAVLTDGQQITVPTLEEAADWTPEESAAASAQGGSQSEGTGKININQAAAEELMTLPGIGEAKAAGIIEYRESDGGFQSIEEIKNVSGIGDAVYSRIKDSIEI